MTITRTRVRKITDLTRAERAQHAYDSYKIISLEKKPRTNGVDLKCPLCNHPDNQFKPGDTVYMASNRHHALHVACVKREIAKNNAQKAIASGTNVLDTVLSDGEIDVTPPTNGNGKHEVVVAPPIKRGEFKHKVDRQPEKLEIEVGAIRISISLVS